MKLNSVIAGITTLLVLVMLVSACKNRESGKSAGSLSAEQQEHEFMRKLEEVNPGLRDPAAVIELIRMTGATFQEYLVNTLDRDSVYLLDSVLSVMNLGIYTVDIAYLVTYERKEEVPIHLDKARALAVNIGAGHLYDHGMFKRYAMAGVPKDSLIMTLKTAAEQLEHDLSRKELVRMQTLFTTGEFIEKLHLNTQLLINADHDNHERTLSLMLLLFHQENSLRQLVGLLDHVRRREEGERFMAMLSDLQLIFMELNTPNELAGINTENITENQIFKDLATQVALIRNQIIDPVYP